jgi:hypothetical protein
MGASWGDFSQVDAATGSGAGTLSITSVQENDLIIAASTTRGNYGEISSLSPSGIPVTKILGKNSSPYQAQYWNGSWRYYYRYYYYNYYWYWNYYYWWYYYPIVVSRVEVYKADDDGTISMAFSEPSGIGTVFSTALKVMRPSLTPGASEEVTDVGFSESAQSPVSVGNKASLNVVQNDLLLAMGMDVSPNAASADITLSGPSSQELFDHFPQYANRSNRIKLWRIKSDATASLTYANCQAGRMVEKLTPNVNVVQSTYPTVTEDYGYFEFQPELSSSGRVLRPQWFNAIHTAQAWNGSFGLRKRWVEQLTTEGSTASSAAQRARIIEMWKIPKALLSGIPVSEAYIYADEATAEDRVTALDLGW